LPPGISIVELPRGAFDDEKRVKFTVAGVRLGFCTAIPLNWLVEDAAGAKTACEYVIEEKIGRAEAKMGCVLCPKGIPRM